MVKLRVAGALVLLGSLAGAARADDCLSSAALAAARVPGVVVVVLDGPRMDVSACGLANQAQARPITADTVFQAASLSKPVVALVAANLAGQGELDLDRPLTAYLDAPYRHDQAPMAAQPVFDTVDDPRLDRITARMVLSHRSGLPNWAFGEPLRFATEPGAGWKYSGEGFALLAAVLERVTGKPLQALAEERVFGPLGMRDSSFVWREDYDARVATAYDANMEPIDAARFHRPIAAASLYTTPADYARFVRALLLAMPGTPPAQLRERQIAVDVAYALDWGLGVGLEEHASGDCLFHHGINDGFQSFFMACPERKRGVLWFSNSDNGLDLAPMLLETHLPGAHPVLGWPVLRP